MEELVKLNITYDFGGDDPEKVADLIRKTLKDVLTSGEIEGVDADNAIVENSIVGERWELELVTGSEECNVPIIVHVCGVKADEQPYTLSKETAKDKYKKPFRQGQSDTFEIIIDDDIGDIFKLRFGFPATVKEAKWKLKSLKLWNPKSNDMFTTDCKNFRIEVAKNMDPWNEIYVVWPDFPLLPVINYVVRVSTSPRSGQMNCGIDIILYGDYGNSGRRSLKRLVRNDSKFQTNQTDQFTLPVVKLGRISKVHVFNDLTSTQRNWFLSKVVIEEPEKDGLFWEFPCQRYFDPEKGDHQTDRILEIGKLPPPEPKDEPAPLRSPSPPPPPKPVKKSAGLARVAAVAVAAKNFKARVKKEAQQMLPSDLWEIWWENRKDQEEIAGEIGVLFVFIGEMVDSADIPMNIELKSGMSTRRKVIAKPPEELGELQKVRIRFNDQVQQTTKWEIAKLHVLHLKSGEMSTFEFDKAVIQKTIGDSTMEASNFHKYVPMRNYIVELHSGDRVGLTTDTRVYVIVRGDRGDTGKRWLVNKAQGRSPLTTGQILIFDLNCVDLGEIKGIRFGHDKRGKDASYFLQKAIIRPTHLADTYVFEFTRPGEETKIEINEEPKPEVHNPNQWFLSWVNEPNQEFDFQQISIMLIGEKKKNTYLMDLELGPGKSRVYKIDLDDDIGELKKVRLSHGPKAKQGNYKAWRVIEIMIENKATGQIFRFKPGSISQPTAVTPTPEPPSARPFVYTVDVFTSISSTPLLKSAQPDMFITFLGQYYISDPCSLSQTSADTFAFQPGQRDSFGITLANDLGIVKGVRLGLNKSSSRDRDHKLSPFSMDGMAIDKVIVRPDHLPGTEYVFTTDLDTRNSGFEWLLSWVCDKSQIPLQTSLVFVLFGGGKKKSCELTLKASLHPGESKEIRCDFDDQHDFTPYKVRVGFGVRDTPSLRWSLVYVRLRCVEKNLLYTFTLSGGPVVLTNDSDGWRELPIDMAPNQFSPSLIQYQLDIYTSPKTTKPLESKVTANIKGKHGDTGYREMLISTNNGKRNFHPGQMDSFRIEAVDLGAVRSLVLGHDETGKQQSWHINKIVLTNRRTGDIYEFTGSYWFDRKMDDGLVERRIQPQAVSELPEHYHKWIVTILMDRYQYSGTHEALSLIICGSQGSSSIIKLSMADGFSAGELYEFEITTELDDFELTIGEVRKIRLGFIEWQYNPAMLIDRVTLLEVVTNNEYVITVQEWLWATETHDGWREFAVDETDVFKYQVTTWTGSEIEANTTSNVYAKIEGTLGDSGYRRLCNSHTHTKPFSRGQMDIFDVEAVNLGEIENISLCLAPETSSDRNNWHLIRIGVVRHPLDSEENVFECNNWFDNSAHKSIFHRHERRKKQTPAGLIPETNYLLYISTGPEHGMGASANPLVEIFGETGRFGPFGLNQPLLSPGSPTRRPFQPGSVDTFPICLVEEAVGRIVKIRIQNIGANPHWFLDKFSLYDILHPRVDTFEFQVFDWLSSEYGDGDSVKEYPIPYIRQPMLRSDYYIIEIENGPNSIPIVTSNVVTCYIELMGATPLTSGVRPLRKNVDKHLIGEPGKINTFSINAVGVGDLAEIRIGHTATDATFKWHIVQVSISWDEKQKIFPCNRILVTTPDSQETELILN